MRPSPSIAMLERSAAALEPMLDEVVFVGAAILETLIDDPGAGFPRPTIDVDIVLDVATRVDYYAIESRLRDLGFGQRPDEPVICRWHGHGLILDVMPANPDILGFANRWYPSGIANFVPVSLPNESTIRCFDGPHFLASKLEAFFSRGKSDAYVSHDFEDIVALVDGRKTLVTELGDAPNALRSFVATTLSEMAKRSDWLDSLEGALGGSPEAARRAQIVNFRFLEISAASPD